MSYTTDCFRVAARLLYLAAALHVLGLAHQCGLIRPWMMRNGEREYWAFRARGVRSGK